MNEKDVAKKISPNNIPGWLFFGVIALPFVIAGLLTLHPIDSEKEAPAQPSEIHLHAAVLRAPAELLITNKDAFDYENVELRVNFDAGGNFKTTTARIARGESKVFALSDFSSAAGERFDPSRLVVKDLYLNCRTPSGPGNCGWEWR